VIEDRFEDALRKLWTGKIAIGLVFSVIDLCGYNKKALPGALINNWSWQRIFNVKVQTLVI
jgi:hypothetical protein